MTPTLMATTACNSYSRASSPVTIHHRRNWHSFSPSRGTPGPSFGGSSPLLGCSPTLSFDCSHVLEELFNLASPHASPRLGASPLHSFADFSIRKIDRRTKVSSILKSDDAELENALRPKRVIFADENGSQLVHVKEFVPDSLEKRITFLQITAGSERRSGTMSFSRLNWAIDFQLPSLNYDTFFTRISQENVCLETAFVDGLRVLGFVRVNNIAFEKNVFLRLTYDDWKTAEDVRCEFYQSQVPGRQKFDKFQFCFPLTIATDEDAKISFAICFKSEAGEFWDNNFGQNYCLGVKKTTVTTP